MRRAAAVATVLVLTLVAAETAAADHFISPDDGPWVTRVSTPPAVLGIGASIRVADTTTNRGDSAEPATRVRYYLSRDRHRNRGDRLLGGRRVGSLGPGGSSRGGANVTIPRARTGSYELLACIGRQCVAARRTVAVKVSAAPVVVSNEPNIGSWVKGDPPRPVAPNLTVSDSDDALMSGASVQIAAPEQGEQLHFEQQLGITGTYDSGTGVLTLRGLAPTGSYQSALRSVSYSHNGDSPSNPRTLGIRVRDAVGVESSPVYISIDVVVN